MNCEPTPFVADTQFPTQVTCIMYFTSIYQFVVMLTLYT